MSPCQNFIKVLVKVGENVNYDTFSKRIWKEPSILIPVGRLILRGKIKPIDIISRYHKKRPTAKNWITGEIIGGKIFIVISHWSKIIEPE